MLHIVHDDYIIDCDGAIETNQLIFSYLISADYLNDLVKKLINFELFLVDRHLWSVTDNQEKSSFCWNQESH